MHGLRDNLEGGRLSYGPNLPDLWRRAGDYVDKLLRGARWYGVKDASTATIEPRKWTTCPRTDPPGQDAQAGVAARCCAASASQRAMSAATSVLCDAGMRGHSGTLIHSR
jgi:hypothetical protein